MNHRRIGRIFVALAMLCLSTAGAVSAHATWLGDISP